MQLKARAALAGICLLALAAAMAAGGSALAYGHEPAPSQVAFEKAFLQETIDHHFAGVKMAELCVDKATSRKLKDVCADIAENQSEEIRVMQRWLDDWYDIEKDPELMPADQQMLAELAALEGREFDVGVSAAFIEHHRVQIGRSQTCLEEAFHRDLIKLCKKQIITQSREIRVFEKVIAGAGRGEHGDDRDHQDDKRHEHGRQHARDDDDRGRGERHAHERGDD